jgi:radical SAM superfamily enzyme YgiQ (UPF0313 family)
MSFAWQNPLIDECMRILLISANTEPFPEPVFPLGAVYVANALKAAGAQVRIMDMRLTNSGVSVRKGLKAFQPDRIGISLRNVDNAAYPCTRFYLPSYSALIKSLRDCCNAPIILGGPAFSLFPDEIAAYLGADGGVKGEGEGAIKLFLDQGHVEIMTACLPDLDSVAFPRDINALFEGFRSYHTMGIQTARGCPNQCIYCTYPGLEGRALRTRHAEQVAGEIAMLHKDFKIRDFFIVDSLFNADEGHMVRVLEAIVTLNLRLRISCYVQPKISDPGIFSLMKKAGCVAVDFGTDSGSPAMLEALRKPFHQDDIRRASQACKDAGIDFCHSLILGGTGETSETIRETVSLMDEVSPRAVIAMTGVRIYPGTELERIAIEQGRCTTGKSLLEPQFYFPDMGPSALLKCTYEETAGRKNWFFPGKGDWSSAFGFKVLNFLYRKGPLWRTFRS